MLGFHTWICRWVSALPCMRIIHIKEKEKEWRYYVHEKTLKESRGLCGCLTGVCGGGVRLGRGCAEMVWYGGAVNNMLRFCSVFSVESSAGKNHEQTSVGGMWLVLWRGCLRLWETWFEERQLFWSRPESGRKHLLYTNTANSSLKQWGWDWTQLKLALTMLLALVMTREYLYVYVCTDVYIVYNIGNMALPSAWK